LIKTLSYILIIFLTVSSESFSQDIGRISDVEKTSKKNITWALIQTIPSVSWTNDRNDHNSQNLLGLKWNITPLNISFSTNKYVSPVQFFMVNPNQSESKSSLTFTRFTTPLGPMMAIASEKGLCLLEFTDRRMLETELKQIEKHFKSKIFPGKSKFFQETEKQMKEYFEGKRKNFDVPLDAPGTEFQKRVWKILQTIPYGETRSYKKQAELLGNVKAVRAVANANGDNRISIMIPCHRVIGEDGKLTGYGGGLWRKKWLIDLEKENS